MKNNYAFMAFSKGAESTEGLIIPKYVGIASVFVLAVNPTKEELESIYKTKLDRDPEYLGEVDVEGTKVKTVRTEFIVKTDPEKCNGINTILRVPFFLRDSYMVNSTKSKVEVIDKYGRTAWASSEEFKAKSIPMYSNGPAQLDSDYRTVFNGERELTQFVKAYLNIPEVARYIDKKWVMNSDPENSEARLESVKEYFKGNFKELKSLIALQPNNKVKVMFGVRTKDGKQYQTAYTHMVLKNNITNYSNLDKDLQSRRAANSEVDTEYFVGPLKEYSIESTNLSSPSSEEPPFSSPATEEKTPWCES